MTAAADYILETRELTKEFKGFVAVNKVNLNVKRGTIHALIGPNGAGKTTCFNLLTKFLTPTSGSIAYDGADITQEQPAAIARRGVIRSFQISAVFPHLSVLENVRIGLQRSLGTAMHFWRSERTLVPLERDAHVLAHRQVREHRRDLERPRQAHASDCRRGGTGDVLAVEPDAARGGRQKVGEQVETGRLARTVGPDQRMDGMAPDLQVDVLDGDEALEFLGQPLGFQDYFLFRHRLPMRCRD